MASVSVAVVMPITCSTTHKPFLNALPLRATKNTTLLVKPSKGVLKIQNSLKEKAVTAATAAALTASMMMPQVAEAASNGVSPSLKNFLLSIGAGGVVLVAILGAVIGVSNFDPVKRG